MPASAPHPFRKWVGFGVKLQHTGLMEPGHSGTDSPYVRLGVTDDASFDAVQEAKAEKLAACGDDLQAKARIEADYDAVLLDRLKQRQAGKISQGAVSASQQEAKAASPLKQLKLPALPQLPMGRSISPRSRPTLSMEWPRFGLAEGQQLWLPLLIHGGLLAWIALFSPRASTLSLILAMGTGITILNLLWRHGRFFKAAFWGFTGLAVGLGMGALLTQPLAVTSPLQELQTSSTLALLVQLLLAITVA
ncbi:MAG: hypothetical protein F4Y87_08985 [Synechococcus sp. SB0665_bin_28]|nr:hypothetical protein [Synechococcus sp. SB0665_bin_28]MYF20787.1 hypothetical protein [Synechococcus sp. SB0677_bin_5]